MAITIHFGSGNISLETLSSMPTQAVESFAVNDNQTLSKELIFFDLNRATGSKTLYLPEPELFTDLLDDSIQLIEAAGGYVQNSRGEALIIFRRGKWDLPKGKIDRGEGTEEAALREVEEECGISGLKILQKICVTYHCYQLHQQFVLKKTHWFLMHSDYQGKLKPQEEEGIRKAEWRSPQALDDIFSNTYPSVLEVFDAVNSSIK